MTIGGENPPQSSDLNPGLSQRRSSWAKRFLFVVVLLAVVLAGSWLIPTSPAPPPPTIQIVYLGRAKTTGLAVFSVSNTCPANIVRSAAYRIQYRTGENWTLFTSALVPSGGMILRPGGQENISLPAPLGVKTWRVELDFWPHNSPGPAGWLVEHTKAFLRNFGVRARGDIHTSVSAPVEE